MRKGNGKSGSVSAAEWERRLLAMHAATDTDEFLDSVFHLLAGTVECDFALANLRNVDGLPMLARDSLGREFGPEYMENFFRLNPSTNYVLMRPGLRVLHSSESFPPDPILRQTPFYQELMKPLAWRHSVALFFWGFFPPIPQNSFCVFRSEDQPDFDADDLARLRLLHPHISAALKRFRKQIRSHSVDERLTALLDSLSLNATLLDWDLRITHQSAGSRKWAARWIGGKNLCLPRKLALPPEIFRECESMKEEWRAMLKDHPKGRFLSKHAVTHTVHTDWRAEISLVLQQESILANPGFLVRFLESSAAEISPALAALSPAEREAALLVAGGLSNGEISDRIGISLAAVKLRLHGAFKKLGVRNRVQLAALLRP